MPPRPPVKPRRRRRLGRPPGTTKEPRITAQARILETTAAWLRQQHPGARSLHHAAALVLDALAQAAHPQPPQP